MHSSTLATWEKGGRRIEVQIEPPAETVDGVEAIEEPLINLYVGEIGGDDLSPEDARSIAA
jgi:hypothetical protein